MGCGGKYHVDGVYIILSAQGGRQLLASLTFSCAGVGQAAKRGVAKAPRPAAQTRTGQARVEVVCKQAAEGGHLAGAEDYVDAVYMALAAAAHAQANAACDAPRPAAQTRMGQARVDVVCKQAAELSVSGAALAWG